MAFDGRKTADKLRRLLRRQEAPVGAILAVLFATATIAVTYFYY